MDTKELLQLIGVLSTQLENRISRSIAKMDKNAANLQANLLNLLLQDFVTKLSTTGGIIDVSPENLSKIGQLDRLFAKFRQNFLNEAMSGFADELLDIAALNGTYYEALGFDKKVLNRIAADNELIKARIGVAGAKNTLIQGSYLDSLAQTSELKNQLKNLVIAQLSGGQSLQQFTSSLGGFIQGNQKDINGALQQYWRQYAYDTYNQVHEIKNKAFADGLGLRYFIYVGSVIPTTRAFCAKKAGKVFSTKEAEKWRNDPDLIAPQSRASYQPLIERGRYNCRHMIKYISDEMAKRIAPEKLKGNKQTIDLQLTGIFDYQDKYTINYDVSDSAKTVLKKYNLNERQLLKMAGGIPIEGLKINKIRITGSNDYLKLSVDSNDISQAREFYFDKKIIDNNVFKIQNNEIKNNTQKVGAKMLYNQIVEAQNNGFETIKTHAYKSNGWNGYYTWARYGYDFEDSKKFRTFAAKHKRNEKSILELMSTQEGRDFWKNNGFSFDAVFDVNNNNQLEILKKYLINERI